MGQFYFNRHRNKRIKAMFLGLLLVFTNIACIYVYKVTRGKEMHMFYVMTASFTAIVFFYILGLISFGQVIEKDEDGEISTYYKLGRTKLKYRTLGRLKEANLEQDSLRYYCLIIKTSEGHSLLLEKHPTLNEANQRLDELRTHVLALTFCILHGLGA